MFEVKTQMKKKIRTLINGELKKRMIQKAKPLMDYTQFLEKAVNDSLKDELDKAETVLKLEAVIDEMTIPLKTYFKVVDEAKKEFTTAYSRIWGEGGSWYDLSLEYQALTKKWFGDSS